MTPHLHLRVPPPHELQPPVWQPAHHVPCPVEPRPGLAAERVGHEPLRRQPRPSHVAARQPVAAQIQLARRAAGRRLHRRIQHVGLCVRDRPANGRGAFRLYVPGDGLARRDDGCFRRPVIIDQAEGERLLRILMEPVSPGQQEPERQAVRPLFFQRRFCQRRREKTYRNRFGGQPVQQLWQREACIFIRYVNARARRQVRPEFPHRGVKGQPRDLCRPVGRFNVEGTLVPCT
jgi:hypothetical protein